MVEAVPPQNIDGSWCERLIERLRRQFRDRRGSAPEAEEDGRMGAPTASGTRRVDSPDRSSRPYASSIGHGTLAA
jgi:hypothetical protein